MSARPGSSKHHSGLPSFCPRQPFREDTILAASFSMHSSFHSGTWVASWACTLDSASLWTPSYWSWVPLTRRWRCLPVGPTLEGCVGGPRRSFILPPSAPVLQHIGMSQGGWWSNGDFLLPIWHTYPETCQHPCDGPSLNRPSAFACSLAVRDLLHLSPYCSTVICDN